MAKQSILSTEWRKYEITATSATGFPYNPTTTATVDFAFRPAGHPPTTSGDWFAGSWETHAGPPVRYVARVLVGPRGVTLDRGEWMVWIRITDGGEVVTRAVDTIQVT